MNIQMVKIKNYRCLKEATVELHPELNVIVGNNECGKSTLLEAINLALSGQLNGRNLQSELHPFLFNSEVVNEYIRDLKAGKSVPPPGFEIELFFKDDVELAALKGTINSLKDNLPGVVISAEFNKDYQEEFEKYVDKPELIKTLPVEYYIVKWRSFADADITIRSIPLRCSFIDASTIRNNSAANKYLVDIMRDSLEIKQRVDLALSYRMMKDAFLENDKVKEINTALAAKKGKITDKELSVSLDTTSKASWETGVMPHLDDIPFPLVGKGEQNSVKIKFALEGSSDSNIVLIEEAENHLSHSNLNNLIKHISDTRGARQVLITTHSSFVLNKLGIENVLMFQRGIAMTINKLTPDTRDYFMKLPGHDTLRLILSPESILVEGPSDELIVQKAYFKKHGRLPIENGVDIISVRSLAFKRFLEIASIMHLNVKVVTDNDGDLAMLRKKYSEYINNNYIQIFYDTDVDYKTLEPQLLKANGKATIEKVLNKKFDTDQEAIEWMESNKSETALRFYETTEDWVAPKYIQDAIE